MAYGTRGLTHPVAEDILRKGCTKGNERFTVKASCPATTYLGPPFSESFLQDSP
jgi:hypothetical protein